MLIKLLFIIIIFFGSVTWPSEVDELEFPEFRVVLDPGHGGIKLRPRKKHGDKYDMVLGKYLEDYKAGASYRDLYEHVVVYQIAARVKKILDLNKTDEGFSRFERILKKYTNEEATRIIITTSLSRGNSTNRDKIKKRRDPNAEFRLFDYPGSDGKIRPGRISRINALKPHLVVALHTGDKTPGAYHGMNVVITAPYSFLYKGLAYLRGAIGNKRFFHASRYNDWFSESTNRSPFYWFLKDVSAYFIGYPYSKIKGITYSKFGGYRYNMVSWAYKDHKGWWHTARRHPGRTRYANVYKRFYPDGKFWERERSVYEMYRRDFGPEGYGGDNFYAGTEIIRYILSSLYINTRQTHPEERMARPYISIWSLPLHINAVCAFIELGYLYTDRHRYLFAKRQDLIAEGIAVGIYSLFAGIKVKPLQYKYQPRGKSLDLAKYSMSGDETYFDAVTAK